MSTPAIIQITGDIVERKLSNCYGKIIVDIPFSAFSQYASTIRNMLHETYDMTISLQTIIEKQEVIDAFELGVNWLVADNDWGRVSDAYDETPKLFASEIEAHLKKNRTAQDLIDAEINDRMAVLGTIHVMPCNREQAIAILKAARLLD